MAGCCGKNMSGRWPSTTLSVQGPSAYDKNHQAVLAGFPFRLVSISKCGNHKPIPMSMQQSVGLNTHWDGLGTVISAGTISKVPFSPLR